jgi:hypothetical protein
LWFHSLRCTKCSVYFSIYYITNFLIWHEWNKFHNLMSTYNFNVIYATIKLNIGTLEWMKPQSSSHTCVMTYRLLCEKNTKTKQKVFMYVKWFHWILSEFIGCNEWGWILSEFIGCNEWGSVKKQWIHWFNKHELVI